MRKPVILCTAFVLVAITFYGCDEQTPTEPVATVNESPRLKWETTLTSYPILFTRAWNAQQEAWCVVEGPFPVMTHARPDGLTDVRSQGTGILAVQLYESGSQVALYLGSGRVRYDAVVDDQFSYDQVTTIHGKIDYEGRHVSVYCKRTQEAFQPWDGFIAFADLCFDEPVLQKRTCK